MLAISFTFAYRLVIRMKKLLRIFVFAVVAVLFTTSSVAAFPVADVVSEIQPSLVSIRVLRTGVEIVNDTRADCDVQVYAITGQLMKHVAAAPGTTVIDLAPGCYVVRVDGLSKRIIIK